MTRHELPILVALIALFSTGCDRYGFSDKGEAADRKMDEQQREAAAERAEIRTETSEKTNEIREDYDEVVAEAEEETAEVDEEAATNVAQIQADENERLREVDRERADAAADLNQWTQKKLDALNAEIDQAKVTAQAGNVAARREFDTAIAQVEADRDHVAGTLRSGVISGEASSEKLKKDFAANIHRLKTRVDGLTKKL